jgi:prostaglandin-endoperoxide synthase 2
MATIPEPVVNLAVALSRRWPWLARKINAVAVNSVCNSARHRPHPWSTVHDYTSWTSLTDQRWSSRHLPAYRRSKPYPAPELLTPMFERRGGEQRLCEKSTLLFPAFAQYLTDGFIRTRVPNKSAGDKDEIRKQNTSNHQIDMCPLYGRLQEQTDALRLNSQARGQRGRLKSQLLPNERGQLEEYAPFLCDQTGKRKPEFDSLDPILGIDRLPAQLRPFVFAFGGDRANATPQVAMINTLFLREHNRLAGEMERLHPDWDDERVFQTARNTVIVVFLKIVIEEYINHISPSVQFRVDPSVAWDAPWNKAPWVTTEFSLLYRWHSLVPDRIEWGGKTYPVEHTLMNNPILIQRGLAGAFGDMSEQRAGRLGSFNTSQFLIDREVFAIDQGRLCELAPYVDYRAYVGLPPVRRFEDITSDPDTVAVLRGAYADPGEIEFYVGLFAEETTKNSPLPPLILRMVGLDAFSQAYTNPLISKNVFKPETFSAVGWKTINDTSRLEDIVSRNSEERPARGSVRMTQRQWVPR